MTRLTRLLPACAALVGLATLTPTLAAPTATITNADEPGRNPYLEFQQTAFFSNADNLVFSPVPAGQRLVLTNVSCVGPLKPTSTEPVNLTVSSGNVPHIRFFFVAMNPQQGYYVGNLQILWFVEPGDSVEVSFSQYDLMSCSLSGYFVKL